MQHKKNFNTEPNLIALRNMASGILRELDSIKKSEASPAPANRNKKQSRVDKYRAFYQNRGIV